MLKLMLLKYLARIEDEAENDVITEKNRCHWRECTSVDYDNISRAMARLEVIRSISRDIMQLLRLYG